MMANQWWRWGLYGLVLWCAMPCLQAQNNEPLAQNYFDRGEFDKAQLLYAALLEQQEGNGMYFERLLACDQQLQQFDKAEARIKSRMQRFQQRALLVELGYNYQLQKQQDKAQRYYNEALEAVRRNVNEVFGIGYTFERKALFAQALQAYEIASAQNPQLNFNFQMGMLYGQLGQPERMLQLFLDEGFKNPGSLPMIQAQLSRFLQEDSSDQFAQMLKRQLLLRLQQDPQVFWNEMLAWMYMQNHEYHKAFLQFKAIFKRKPETLQNIVQLGQWAQDARDWSAATDMMQFVLEQAADIGLKIQAHTFLIQQQINQQASTPAIQAQFEAVYAQYGRNPLTLPIALLQARWSCFNQQQPETAKAILQTALGWSLNRQQTSETKLLLGQVYLYQEKFNVGLLTFSQLEQDNQGDWAGQEAQFLTAKTAYYKADFDWALHQLKVLKSATSLQMANDALDLYLLIHDIGEIDSTYAPLQPIARGDFLVFQRKTEAAKATYQSVLDHPEWSEVYPVVQVRLGDVWREEQCPLEAIAAYEKVIQSADPGIYVDEALYHLGCLYQEDLQQPDKAMTYFETLIFKHPDSIYYVEARKRYRQLRGDQNL